MCSLIGNTATEQGHSAPLDSNVKLSRSEAPAAISKRSCCAATASASASASAGSASALYRMCSLT